MIRLRAAFALVALALVSACGLRGDLEPAPPMWGEARERYEAEQDRLRQEEEAKQRAAEEAQRPAPDAPPQ